MNANRVLYAAHVSFNGGWSNPCDEYEPELSMFTFHLDSSLLKGKAFHRLEFRFDLKKGMMRLFVDGKPAGECAMKRGFNIGLSYVNIQSDAPAVSEGVYLKTLRKSDD